MYLSQYLSVTQNSSKKMCAFPSKSSVTQILSVSSELTILTLAPPSHLLPTPPYSPSLSSSTFFTTSSTPPFTLYITCLGTEASTVS